MILFQSFIHNVFIQKQRFTEKFRQIGLSSISKLICLLQIPILIKTQIGTQYNSMSID